MATHAGGDHEEHDDDEGGHHSRRHDPRWEAIWPLIPDTATPVSVYRFLTIERNELQGWSVRDWLAAGEPVGPVLDMARGWHGP